MPASSTPPPGSIIAIKVNGEEFCTIIDKNGIQRFRRIPEVAELCDAEGIVDLNQLAIHVKKARPTVSVNTRRWLYRAMGYSVNGYEEIFPTDKIENPLWEEEGRAA